MTRRIPIVVLVCLAAACGEDAKEQQAHALRHDRGDAAAVVIVDRAPSVTVSVATADSEVEPNDSAEQATELALPGAFKGTLNSSNDVDRYKITPPETGMIAARLTGTDVDLELSLEDETGKTVIAVSDRGPAQTEEGLPNFPVVKGRSYLLTVTEYVKVTKKKKKRKKGKKGKKGKEPEDDEPARKGESGEYTLSAAMYTPANERHEVEPNDAGANARTALLGDELFGYIGWTGDVDQWKVALTGFSKSFGLDLTIQGIDGVTYKLEILDSAGKTVLERESEKGRPVFLRGVVPNEGEKFYTAKLSAKRSNPQQPYSLEMASRDIDDTTEVEPNDSSKQATALVVDGEQGERPTEGTRKGFLVGGDVDYYKFEAGKQDLSLDVSVAPPNSTDIKLSIRAGGATNSADNGKSGATEELAGIRVKAGKSAYIVIKGSFDGDRVEPYELTWTTSEAAAENPLTPDLDDFDKDFE